MAEDQSMYKRTIQSTGITIQPVFTRILARQYEDDKVGSIYVPEQVKQASLRATVIAVGEDVTRVAPRDKILVGRYAKFQVPLRGEEFTDMFIMNEADILATLHEGDDDAKEGTADPRCECVNTLG